MFTFLNLEQLLVKNSVISGNPDKKVPFVFQVKRVLPHWLANPSIISCNLKDATVPINSLGLDSELISLLEANFIPYFFPVQHQVIPGLIRNYSPVKLCRQADLCISAPTGSGKTLAYVLPLVHILKGKSFVPCVRAIVVLPTEVLASQVFGVFKAYTKGTDLNVFLMSKNQTLTSETESLVLKSKMRELIVMPCKDFGQAG